MKKLLLLFGLFISINSYSQNIYWYDVIIDVNGEDWQFEIYPRTILLKVKATLP